MKKLNLALLALPALLVSAALAPATARADEPMININVGEARTKKSVVAFPTLQAANDADGVVRSIREITMEDLAFSGLFDFLNPAAFVEPAGAGILPGSFKMTDWSSIGAEFVMKGKGVTEGKGIALEIYLYSTASGKQLLAGAAHIAVKWLQFDLTLLDFLNLALFNLALGFFYLRVQKPHRGIGFALALTFLLHPVAGLPLWENESPSFFLFKTAARGEDYLFGGAAGPFAGWGLASILVVFAVRAAYGWVKRQPAPRRA